MIINFIRDDETVASISDIEVLTTGMEHMRGYMLTDRVDAKPLLFKLRMTTIRNLTMKNVSFDVTAYVLSGNRVIQIVNMEAGMNKYMTEPSNIIIEVPSDYNLDITLGDSVSFIEEKEEGSLPSSNSDNL